MKIRRTLVRLEPSTNFNYFENEPFSCGYGFGETVSREYHGSFAFTGDINHVTVDLSGELIKDDEADMRRLMAQQ